MLDKEIESAIRQNPSLTVKQFAQRIGMKVRTFYRRWLKENSPKKWLDLKRLEIAKWRLLYEPKKKISEIARDLSFCDHYYFSKWFRRKIGVSPQKYRMSTLKEREALERRRGKRGVK